MRALKLMKRADVALYDNLISPEVLALLPARVERIYVGKRRADHTMRQEAINALLVELAQAGKRVLRLKGGDPFVFGRGGEEIDTLTEHGIPFEVVPGITAALGAAAYAGIPLTHRDYAQSCVFVTGHLKDGSMDLDWPALARARQTIVVYMGLPGLSLLCRKLVEHGLSRATARGGRPAGNDPDAARDHRNARDAARPGCEGEAARADADHRRGCRAAARKAQLVRSRRHEGKGTDPGKRIAGGSAFPQLRRLFAEAVRRRRASPACVWVAAQRPAGPRTRSRGSRSTARERRRPGKFAPKNGSRSSAHRH